MIHIQVKAKSGLHAGATWKLDNSNVTLGANSHADVFLCDPDIPDTLLTLQKRGRRYNIENLYPEARLSAPDQRKIDNILFPSQLLTLDFKHIQLELMVVNGTSSMMSALNDSFSRTLYNIVQLLRGIGARAIVALLFVIGLLLTTVVLFFGTAGVVKSEASVIEKPDLKKDTYRAAPLGALETRMAKNVAIELNNFAEQISNNQMKVTTDGTQVNADVVLSRAQAVGFERLLTRLAVDYGSQVQIAAKLELSEEQLRVDQIEIEQVVLGNRPVVVLRDGVRLYVGGTYQGVNLTSINSNKLVFQGDATYEVML